MALLTTSDVAFIRGVTRGAVVKWITHPTNPLAAEKIGRDYMIKEQDALAYVPSPITGRPRKK